MTAHDLMTTVVPHASIAEAWDLMRDLEVGASRVARGQALRSTHDTPPRSPG